MLKFPRKEEGKKEKEMKGRGKQEKQRKEGRKGRKRKERKEMRKNGVVYWDRRRQYEKRNEGA